MPSGIGVLDPGAVPGTSTVHGGEIGSTGVVKVWCSFGIVPPLSGKKLMDANNNSIPARNSNRTNHLVAVNSNRRRHRRVAANAKVAA